MATQPNPIFIQACEGKIYGPKIWINPNSIASFGKDKQFSIAEGQWYKVILFNGTVCYTLYNLISLSIYTLPAY